MRTLLVLTILCAIPATSQAQNPWPMERQDRWGTARAVSGPNLATVTTPWLFLTQSNIGLVSNCPSLTKDGLGYVTSWLENKVVQLSQVTGGITGSAGVNNWGQATPAVGLDGEVYSATVQGGYLYRINPASMSFDWQFNTGNGKVSDYDSCSPTIGPDGHVMMGGTGGSVWKINRYTGQFLWKASASGGVIRTIVFTRDDTKVIVSSGSSITAYDYATGLQSWTKNLGSTTGAPGVAPNGTIIVGTGVGNVYGLNPSNGTQIWTFVTGGAVTGGPAFSTNGSIAYIGSYDKKLYAANVSNGSRPWVLTTADEIHNGPIVDTFGRVYVATRSSTVYCANADGSLRWNIQLDYEVRGPMSIDPNNTLYVPNGQLRIIRQQAINFDVLGLLVGPGKVTSGGKEQLATSDDNYAVVEFPSIEATGMPVMQTTFVTNSPYKKTTKFSFVIESRVDSNLLTQTIEILNTVSGTWQVVDIRDAPVVDTTTRIDVPAIATDYQDNYGGIRARVSYWLKGKAKGPFLHVYFDYAKFVDVVPDFHI